MALNLKFVSGMGQKNTKGTVSINDTAGRIRLRWRHRTIRYSINLNAYNKIDLLIAKKAALQIERDIANDKFDTMEYTVNHLTNIFLIS